MEDVMDLLDPRHKDYKRPTKENGPNGSRAANTTRKEVRQSGKGSPAGSASIQPMRAALHEALAHGLDVHWLHPAKPGDSKSGKNPVAEYKTRAVHTLADEDRLWKEYRKGYGLGMRIGRTRLVVVDADPPADEKDLEAFNAELARLLGGKRQPTVISGSGVGGHFYIQWPEHLPMPGGAELWKGGKHEEIRLLGVGANVVLPPTLHGSGKEYRYVGEYSALKATPALIEAAKGADSTIDDTAAAALEAVELDLSTLPTTLRERIEKAGASGPGFRSAGIHSAVCILREARKTPGQALWMISASDLPFCSKAQALGELWAAKEVLRIWRKHEASETERKSGSEFGSSTEPADEEDESFLHSLQLPQMPDEALYGILRNIVDAATATSEATRPAVAAAVLVNFAARYGRALGMDIGDERRTLPFYALVVGPTGRGRKGTSTHFARRLFVDVDKLLEFGWGDDFLSASRAVPIPPLEMIYSFSSGQGLIQKLADDSTYTHRGLVKEVRGTDDKRLLAEVTEFGSVFSAASMDASILSQVIRDAYDGQTLDNNVRSNPLRATRPHLNIFGQITLSELRRRTVDGKRTHDETQSGLLNRFVVLYSVRTRTVSNPEPVPDAIRNELASALAGNVHKLFDMNSTNHLGYRAVVLKMSDEAQCEWDKKYEEITRAIYDTEIVSAMMGRRELLTLLIAALLAAMNGESVIGLPALRAALAWGEYVVQTNARVFATLQQRKQAAELKADIAKLSTLLRSKGDMKRRDVQNHFHKTSFTTARQDRAMAAMVEASPPELEIIDGTTLHLRTM